MNATSRLSLRSLSLPAWTLLLIAALNGLLYVFVVPPWEHNDEPGNFEYAWMFANMPGRREEWVGKNDPQFRREVASSMVEEGFFEHHPVGRPNLIALDQEVWIGLQQTAGLPFYFWLASLPLRLLRYTDIVLQLYAARLVSWFLFCLTVYFSIRVNRELNWHAKWGESLPLLFALFPSFVDKMTAVNDDVGAVAFFTLFLWFGVRIWKSGISPLNLLGLIASTLLCVLTKRNVWVSVPLGILLLLMVFLRRWKWVQWSFLGAMFLIVPAMLFSFDYRTPAYFYAFGNQQLASVVRGQTLMGNWAAYLAPGYHLMHQPLPKDVAADVSMQSVRVGYWLWGRGQVASSPVRLLIDGQNVLPNQAVSIPEKPLLIQHTLRLPASIQKLAIEVSVVIPEESELYLDCLFLVPESGSETADPVPRDGACTHFSLGSTHHVSNLVRNGSFEQTRLRLQPWLEKWVDEKFAFSITHLWAILDRYVGYPYLRGAGGHVFQTFWGRFGWGGVPLSGTNPYAVFVLLLFVLTVGNLIALVRERLQVPWDLIVFLFLAFGAILIMTLFRNGGNWIWYEATPNARYLMPAFLPLALFFVQGLGTLMTFLKYFKKNPPQIAIALLVALIGYNVWAITSIWSYFVEIRS